MKNKIVIIALILGSLDLNAWTEMVNDTAYKINAGYTADMGIIHWFRNMNPSDARYSNDGAINVRRKYIVEADEGDGYKKVLEKNVSDQGNVVATVYLKLDTNGNPVWDVRSSGGRISKDGNPTKD